MIKLRRQLWLGFGENWKSKCTLRYKDIEGQTEYQKQNEQLWGDKTCEMRDTDFVPKQQCAFIVIPLPQSNLSHDLAVETYSHLSVTTERTNHSLSVSHSSAEDEAALLFICVLIKFCHVTVEYKDPVVGNWWILKAWVAGCFSSLLWWPSFFQEFCITAATVTGQTRALESLEHG